jgi:hypothetical protein
MCDLDLNIDINQYYLLNDLSQCTYFNLKDFEEKSKLLTEYMEKIKINTVFNSFAIDVDNYLKNIQFIQQMSSNNFTQIQYMIDIIELKNRIYYTAIYNYLVFSVKRLLYKYLTHIDTVYHINIMKWMSNFEVRLKKKIHNIDVKLLKKWISIEILSEFKKLYMYLKIHKKEHHLQSNTILLNLKYHSKNIEELIFYDKLQKFYDHWENMRNTLIKLLYSKLTILNFD